MKVILAIVAIVFCALCVLCVVASIKILFKDAKPRTLFSSSVEKIETVKVLERGIFTVANPTACGNIASDFVSSETPSKLKGGVVGVTRIRDGKTGKEYLVFSSYDSNFVIETPSVSSAETQKE